MAAKRAEKQQLMQSLQEVRRHALLDLGHLQLSHADRLPAPIQHACCTSIFSSLQWVGFQLHPTAATTARAVRSRPLVRPPC